MAQGAHPDRGRHPSEEQARFSVPIAVALATFAVTAGVTYSQDLLTPLGNAVAAGAAAVISGSIAYLFFPTATRSPAVLVMLLSVGLLAFAGFQLRDEAPRGVANLVGGCDAFTVYAQNRYNPVGTAIRAVPLPTARKVASFAANELVAVDGWVRTQPAYPSNSPPFDSDVWFHLADDSGWVSFAGVRADPTSLDPTGFAEDGGRPAPLAEECSGTHRM